MEIGTLAPSFELPDQDKNTVALESFRGSKTLVVFIPFPYTGLCDDEACTIRDNLADLGELDAKVVVVTVHAVPMIKKWADENSLPFPVLSDYWPHGETAKAYGAFNETTGGANRYTFALDADLVVRDIINTEELSTIREYASYVEALKNL